MSRYVAAIDQGTTSTRCMIFNHSGEPVGIHQLEHEQIYPKAGWVEHDPSEIWERTQEVIRGALKKAECNASDIVAVGITNQRETTVIWDRATLQPIHPAIVWQDRRTAALCADLRDRGVEDMIRARTGLLLDPYFKEQVEAAQSAWRRVVAKSVEMGIPVPAMSSALAFYDGYREERLPANLLQAQRDYFGAHTYERVDKPRGEFFHSNWTGTGSRSYCPSHTRRSCTGWRCHSLRRSHRKQIVSSVSRV